MGLESGAIKSINCTRDGPSWHRKKVRESYVAYARKTPSPKYPVAPVLFQLPSQRAFSATPTLIQKRYLRPRLLLAPEHKDAKVPPPRKPTPHSGKENSAATPPTTKRTPLPMPADTPAERAAFWNTLTAELPRFLHWLLHEYTINPAYYGRFGILHFHHPDLCSDLFEVSRADEWSVRNDG